MNKNFWFAFVSLILAYIFVPQLSAILTFVGVFIIICQLAAAISNVVTHSRYSAKLFIPPTNRIVIVTGCDSGFGLAVAQRLDQYGFYVLAGVLSKESEGAKLLETYSSKRMRIIKLDVTKKEDIDDAVDLVAYLTNYKPILDKLNEKQSNLPIFDRKFRNQIFGNMDGELKLWALVNNAGVCNCAPLEFGIVEKDLIPMFDVNVFGVIAMTRSFLPFLRQTQGSRLVNVGSVAGRFTVGGLIGYSMTKHAIRSLTDGLRQELRRFKIRPILIEPTLYKTPISNVDQLINQFNQIYDRTEKNIKSDYGDEQQDRFTKHLKKMIVLTRTNIDEVIDSIEDAVTNAQPQVQYWCASFLQKIIFWTIDLLNTDVTDSLFSLKPPRNLVNFMQKININS